MHQRAAFIAKAGLEMHNDTEHWLATHDHWRDPESKPCYNVPAELICTTDPCPTYTNDKKAYTTNPALSPVCTLKGGESDWFDLMMQYHGLGTFLSWVSVITIILYFVTSSDSGSLVVDLIAANGRDAHVIQRVFWAFSEGAVAIVVMKTGGKGALGALRALSIIAGLPFTFILMYICSALWRALATEMDKKPKLSPFKLPLYAGIFDYIECICSCGKAPTPDARAVLLFFQGLFVPPLPLLWALRSMNDGQGMIQDVLLCVGSGLTFYGFILCHALQGVEYGLVGLGWTAWVAFTVILAYVRHVMRIRYNIAGNGIEDFFASLMFYPQVLAQLAIQADEPVPEVEPSEDKDNLQYVKGI
jgi:hypothetical protein